MMSERQQGGVGHGGSLGEITAAGCFPGPELRVGSRAGGGRSAAGARQLCGSAGTGQLRDDGKYGCMYAGGGMWSRWPGMPVSADCPQRRAIQNEFNKQWLDRQRLAPKAAVDSRRRWEARWEAREAREKAARARKRAAQNQGNKTGPTQAGPCAACARWNDLRAVGVGGEGMYTTRRLARIISERFGVERLQSM